MSAALYAKAKKLFLDGDIDLLSDDIKAVLVDTADYTVDLDAHDYLDDVAAGARVATSGNLASKTTTGGVFDAADVTLSAVTGDTCEAIIIYKDSGAAATSPLIAYIDEAAGLPFTPDGNDALIEWDNGPTRIFAL